ncbi:uncharacterized protein LOC134747947 [Cydia strobilella]|uniref:uncharacterized protein LOC134747947 n=1 Tax=Cydia strobilella TaxID=1100964 RepID=UPI0030050AFD
MSNLLGSLTLFDHTSQEWEIFKSRLVQYIKLNEVKDDNKCALLLTHLSDETYRLVRNLVHPKKVEGSKFDELVDVLDKQLAPKRCIFVERAKFYEATRDVAENIEQWAARISGLAVRCEFGAPLDELLRDRFVLGLSVGPERDRLFEQDAATLTFAKAVEVAQKAAYARSARTTSVPAAVVQVKQEPMYRVGTSRPGTGGSSDSRRCSVCGLKSHDASKCKYKNYRCQVCGQKGHLKKVCNAEKAKQCRVNCIQADLEGSAEASQSAEGCKECELFNLRYVNYAPILLDVALNGKNLTMELDCGSGIMRYTGSEKFDSNVRKGDDDDKYTWFTPPPPSASPPPSPPLPLNPPLSPTTVTQRSDSVSSEIENEECNTELPVEKEAEQSSGPNVEPASSSVADRAPAPPLRVGPTLRPRTKEIDYACRNVPSK